MEMKRTGKEDEEWEGGVVWKRGNGVRNMRAEGQGMCGTERRKRVRN